MKRLLTSCFGLGLSRFAPGSLGSLPPVIVFALLACYSFSAWLSFVVLTALVLAGSFICIKFAPAIISATAKIDPREVVADEFAGQAFTFLFILPFLSVPQGDVCVIAALGFLLFRLFDIVKPFPVASLERLPAGLGILADDLGAGIYAGICLIIALKTGLVAFIAGYLQTDKASLNLFSAAFLGLVQGLTEFLPVSSSGHLVLFEHIFGLPAESPQMLLFDLIIHTATVIAIFFVFRKQIALCLSNLISSFYDGNGLGEKYKNNPSVRITILAVITTLVTAAIGFPLEKIFTEARASVPMLSIMWFVNGTFLLITDRRKKARLGLRNFGITMAVIIGIAQAVAIIPSISRSGATICAAILLGLHRRWAVEYSFFIAIPAILGATVVELVKNIGQISSEDLPLIPLAAAFILAVISGILALKILVKVTRRGKLKFFAFYCYLLAFVVLIYSLQ